jgi:hypothetical protein
LVPRFWFEKPKKPNLIKGGAAAITVTIDVGMRIWLDPQACT